MKTMGKIFFILLFATFIAGGIVLLEYNVPSCKAFFKGVPVADILVATGFLCFCSWIGAVIAYGIELNKFDKSVDKMLNRRDVISSQTF